VFGAMYTTIKSNAIPPFNFEQNFGQRYIGIGFDIAEVREDLEPSCNNTQHETNEIGACSDNSPIDLCPALSQWHVDKACIWRWSA